MECKNTENIGWEDWKLLYLWSTDFVSTCQISCPYGYICSFSLRLHKENEPKEMRFAAARFLPKIGRFSPLVLQRQKRREKVYLCGIDRTSQINQEWRVNYSFSLEIMLYV